MEIQQRTQAERTKDALLSGLEEALQARFQTVESGPMEGVNVLTNADFERAWAGFLDGWEMPEVTDHAAEVTTPARVVVAAVCPHCHLTTDATVRLSVKLEETSTYSRVKVIGRTDPVDHRCGQMAMRDVTPGDPDQGDLWDVKDITGGGESIEDDPGSPQEPLGATETPATPEDGSTCPWPGCVREAGHRGRHAKEKA
jgi:hypothetical protein